MPIFFISSRDIHGSIIPIQGSLFTHLHKSLRVQQGDRIFLNDEQRRRHHVQIAQIDRKQLVVEILDTQMGPAPETPAITLVQSILKGEKMNWVVQKATELGVAQIVPLLSERVISRPTSAQSERQQARWQRIALEAAQQAERWDVPPISQFRTFTSLTASPLAADLVFLLTERENGIPLTTVSFPLQWERGVTLIVGPEGGWTQSELEKARQAGIQNITLGQRILRSETAAISALSIAQGRLGHME